MGAARKRGAFVTIGQSPRDDILSEMRPLWSDGALEVDELGALDGLSDTEIASLAAGTSARLVTRLADGREVSLNAAAVEKRTVALVQEIARRRRHDLVVLLCTGTFHGLPRWPLVVESQRVMDNLVAALAPASSRIGVLVPHPEQAESFFWALPNETHTRHASPYGGDGGARLDEAAEELARAGVDLIALHCMGYSETNRARVARATGKPVLLARRVVASAVAQLL